MISIPAFLLSYGVAGLLPKQFGDTYSNVTSGIAKQMAQSPLQPALVVDEAKASVKP